MVRQLFTRAVLGSFLVVALGAPVVQGVEYSVGLDPLFDQFGQAVYTTQAYTGSSGQVVDLGIYDTGASVITFGAHNSGLIPIKIAGGAGGSGIGGDVIGDVSQPGSLLVGGFDTLSINFSGTGDFLFAVDTNPQTAVPNLQTFVATPSASPNLPTLTGTPIHNPSPMFPTGSAAYINMTGIEFDFGGGLVVTLPFPSFSLVAPATAITPNAVGSQPVVVPLGTFGVGNYGTEGDELTSAPNPTFDNVTLRQQAEGGPEMTLGNQRFLFDTGAQVSLISTQMATALGLNLAEPETTIQVQGAAGVVIDIPGFTISGLQFAAAVDGALADDVLAFHNVPVFVYDLNIPGLDGILGMNVFNTADQMLYDPINQQLSVSFLTNPNRYEGWEEDPLVAALLASTPAFAGHIAPAFGLGPVSTVPEPAAAALVLLALSCLALRRWRGVRGG